MDDYEAQRMIAQQNREIAEYNSGVEERRQWRHNLEMAATDAVVRQILGYEQRMSLAVTSPEGAK